VGQGPDGERFIYITIKADGSSQKVLVRYDDFRTGSTQVISRLNKLGAHLISPAAVSEFSRRLQELGPQEPSFKVATRVGPFGDAFVLPHGVVSAEQKDIATYFDERLLDYMAWGRKGGTLKGWQEIAELAEGSSRLILALGVALAGPLRMIAPVESIAFQLCGPGGTGKTSIGVIASSIWGQRLLADRPHPLGGGDAWNNTISNLERVLAARDHTFLFLNEAHLTNPKDMVEAIFTIREGQGRGRYTELSRWEWFAPVLSTSNKLFSETLLAAREPIDRAALDRLIDVPLPGDQSSAFENLHGSQTVEDFVVRLKAICDDNFGVAGRVYVRKILHELADDPEGLAHWLERRRDYFRRVARKRASNNDRYARVISHFATVYSALRLSDRYKVLALRKGSASRALLACLQDHLRVTSAAEDQSTSQTPLAQLRGYIRKNRDAFVRLSGTTLPPQNLATCPGYLYEASGRSWLAFPHAVAEQIVGGRGSLSSLCHDLDSLGLIKKVGGGQGGNRFATKLKVGSKRIYMLCIDERLCG